MKRSLALSIIPASILLVLMLTGCVKDNIRRLRTYTFYEPVYKTTEQVKAGIKSMEPRDIENPGKLFIRGNYIFLNEMNKGIHIINNQNPAAPKNVAFVDIPGNIDLAVKGNALYADLYTDLVTLDISNPLHVELKNYVEGVFPHRYYYNFAQDTSKMIVDWIRHDTTITEVIGSSPWYPTTQYYADNKVYSATNSSSPIGVGGSMARFAIVSDYMYTVSNSDLNVFDISKQYAPAFANKVALQNWAIETIYPFKGHLFIGSQSGMYVYSVSNPESPEWKGQFAHVQSCDPVIADDDFAYVTLRTGNTCMGTINQLEILNLSNFSYPQLVKTYSLTSPHGLSKDGHLLFICDGNDGLKIYDATDVSDLKLKKRFSGIDAYDVIAYNKIAIVVGKDGLYQYDYSNAKNIHLLSKLSISRN